MDISTIKNEEYVLLVGHFNNVGGSDERAELEAKGYNAQQIEVFLKQKRGKVVTSLDIVFKGSNKLRHPLYDFYSTAYYNYMKHGLLPYPGALVDQPAKIIEVLQIFEMLSHEKEKQQIAEIEKKRKNKR
jgi:hypothetical protein